MADKREQCKSCKLKCPQEIFQAKLNKGRIPFDKCMDFTQIQTNADKIRNMTDEELAEFLIRQHACDCCDFYGRGARCNAPDGFVCTNGYASAIIQKWLQEEAE